MNQHLQQFSQQLATWTQAIIEYGRSPFRRVDTYPHLDTEQGILQPPLVFWINRQSLMAGGVLLLPDNNLAEELERGRSCASALGLRHFVTWESDRVRIWHIDKDQIKELRSFPLSSPSQPDTFRYLLTEILDELKLLAVLGAIPATELSPYYFNNLFQTTLQQALPPLVKAYREKRSEIEEYSTEDADRCANEENRLLILQIVSILWFDKVPETIRSSLQETVNLQDVERFLTIFKKNSFDFDLQTYYLKEANEFFYNGHLVDVKITEPQMKSFIEENAQMFSVLVDEYIKKLKIISSK
jgi:hypothetical protein